jgi:Na+(H+)/acetate symporter ActP
MLSSVTTELAVAASGSLGCISAGSIAGCLGFSAGLFVCVKSGLAQLLYRNLERVALWLWLSF